MKTTTCRSCRASIFWAVSPAGKMVPVDELPIAIEQIPPRAVAYSVKPGSERTGPPHTLSVGAPDLVAHRTEIGPDGAAYVSHFVTCPNAATHSRKASAHR